MKKVISSLIIIFFLVACNSEPPRSHPIYFKENIKIAYQKEDVNTCEYIVNVDDVTIKSSMIEDDTIYVSNFSIRCPSVNANKLGKVNLVYSIDDEEYEVDAMVADLTKPKITIEGFKNSDNAEFSFEENEINDISTLYKVSDNLDKIEDIKVKQKGEYDLAKAGVYTITISATDTSKNTTSRTLKITIKEPQKNTSSEENVPPSGTTSNNNGSSGGNNNNNSSNSGGGNTIPVNPNPIVQDYLFSQGYNMITAPQECQDALLSSGRAGTCTAIVGDDGMPIGMRLTIN